MSQSITRAETSLVVLRLRPAIELDEEQFFQFCGLNDELRIERTAEGDLEINRPTGGETGSKNAMLTAQLAMWAWHDGTGTAYDSSTGFNLPNGATRSPDASWVHKSRLAALTPRQRERFMPICPDFVAELYSPSDTLTQLQAKMNEYIENGALLGWLLYPPARRVYVYRPDREVEVLDGPTQMSGEPELPGFVLDLAMIWGTAS